uniref:Uncharacterized protein n=1 Tax=Rhipicephalus zambeziensis TaxID=60191 RepID=A0A224YAX0_9ACAR
MWNEEICSRPLPTRTSGPPRCFHGPWYPCRGPLCGFDPCAMQSSIRFMQVLDEREPTLAYVPGKYPCLKIPPVPSTNLTFNVPVFQKGVKDSGTDEKKQWELPDHESEAVQPPAVQTIPTNDPRCAQAVASHRWFDSAFQADAEVSQLHGTRIQTWRCRTVETDASQPGWADQEAQACRSHGTRVPIVPAPWHPGHPGLYCRDQGCPSPLSPA